MHIADVEGGNLGANGIVAGGLPIAVGVGLSLHMQARREVCMVFFGDGATNEGAFHEALNVAAIWKLPVVFVCENNVYAMSTSIRDSIPTERISQRAAAYAIPGVTVDGNDLPAVYTAAATAVARARAGEGPSLIEAQTYRWRGHSKSDRNLYRTQEEIAAWKVRDPIPRLRDRLLADAAITPAEADALSAQARAEVAAAVAFAEASPDPDTASLEEEVYA